MKKILVLALVGAGAAAFVGFDVVGASVRGARHSLRASLSSSVPLKTQLAEARAAVDAYAENVIRGEVAAESLSEAIDQAEGEVRRRSVALERERGALADLRDALRDGGMLRPASFGGEETTPDEGEREAVRRARRFEAASAILARRAKDLEALRAERDATLAEVAAAKDQQARLSQEVEVLAAEVQSLEARQSVARTREGYTASTSGYGAAEERIRAIRSAVREQNKRLRHYAMRDSLTDVAVDPFPMSAVEAIDAALGAPEAVR